MIHKIYIAKVLFRYQVASAVLLSTIVGATPLDNIHQVQPKPAHHAVKKPSRYGSLKARELLLAKTLWGEARRDGATGMLAVAHVILNRAKSNHPKIYGGTRIEDVVLKRYAFSCWLRRDPNYKTITHMEKISNLPLGHPDRTAWAEAQQIAHVVLQHDAHDPTRGATFYYATSMKTPPAWAASMKHLVSWKGHEFFRPYTTAERKARAKVKEIAKPTSKTINSKKHKK